MRQHNPMQKKYWSLGYKTLESRDAIPGLTTQAHSHYLQTTFIQISGRRILLITVGWNTSPGFFPDHGPSEASMVALPTS